MRCAVAPRPLEKVDLGAALEIRTPDLRITRTILVLLTCNQDALHAQDGTTNTRCDTWCEREYGQNVATKHCGYRRSFRRDRGDEASLVAS